MKQNKQRKGKQNAGRKISPLPIAAGVVLLAAAAVTLLPRLAAGGNGAAASGGAALSAGSDIVMQAEEIGADASYFDYDADGTTVEVFAVKASDGTVRLALNTCQVCNGSPYAYFEQEGDEFICQNCKNRFASTDVGQESGGCNPVPITGETYTRQDGTITVPASFLEENAFRFTKWKKL